MDQHTGQHQGTCTMLCGIARGQGALDIQESTWEIENMFPTLYNVSHRARRRVVVGLLTLSGVYNMSLCAESEP